MKPHCTIKAFPRSGLELRAYHSIAQPFTPHSHDEYVIGLVENGHRSLICNGQHFQLNTGDLLVLNPGDVHECTCVGDKPFIYTSLVIAPYVFGDVMVRGPVLRSEAARSAFSELVSRLRSGIGPTDIKDLLHGLKETLVLDSPVSANDASPLAQRIQSSFRHDPSSLPDLAELANEEGISKYQLIRAYKKDYAITPIAHLASFRIAGACELLRSGTPPAKVATSLGFADQPHLTRVFKKQLGTTPKAYQRMACSAPDGLVS